MMFGSVLAVTAHHGLFLRILGFIAAHGPLELFLMVVASAAGLQMARGQLVWENEPRTSVFRRHAAAGFSLLAGTLPWIVLLGVVEGFVSPRNEVDLLFKIVLGAVLLATFLAYGFVSAPESARCRPPRP